MDDLRFASPYALLLLLLLPPLAVYVRRARRPALRIGTLATAAAMPRTWRLRLGPLPPALRLLAIATLIVAVARPQRASAAPGPRGEGIDIVLAFDVSSSMTQPFARSQTKMQAADDVLTRFIRARTDDRVGLVVFRAGSITMSPLTTDYDALTRDVKIGEGIRLPDGTAIGLAIGESVNLLRSSSAASRIVILLTDGENNQHQIEPAEAAQIARQLGVRVYTVGVVSRGLNPAQSTVQVDEQSLRQIAETTGGVYNRAEDPNALSQIYASIDQLEKSRFDTGTLTRYNDLAPYLLAAVAALLAVEVALRFGVLRRAPA